MSKGLMAFALVAEEYERTGDPLLGLKPLFAPLLLAGRGAQFDAAQFSSDFTKAYGLEMTPFVAAALSERMQDLGLLEKYYENNTGDIYRVKNFDWDSEPIAESQVESTIKLFVQWASSKSEDYGRAFAENHLEDAILARLARPEYASVFTNKAEENNSRLRKLMGMGGAGVAANDDAFFDYLVAAFILHVADNAPVVFDSISQISYGALIADAVAGLAVPERREENKKGLRLVFDAPLLLDILDLNSPMHKEYASGLLAIANEAGLMLATFDHSIEEMRQTIQATLEASARGLGHGPMAHRLRTEPGKRLSAIVTRDRLREKIEELGVTILRAETYREARYSKWFPEERLDAVRNAIGDLHENLEARIRDAESVAAVARLKGARGDAESLFDAGTIFVTRNSVLAKRVNRFLSRGRTGPRPTFTIATDGQVAGVLWFVGGMRGVELSRRRLIANCSAAVLPKRELISRIASTLEGIEPSLRDEFQALMADARASLCIMRLTAGDIDLIDRDKSIEVVEEMRRELAAPANERAVAAERFAEEVKKDAEEKISEFDKELGERRSELAQAKEEVRRQSQQFEMQLAQLQINVDREVQEKRAAFAEIRRASDELENDINFRLNSYNNKRRDLVRRMKVELLILGVVLAFAVIAPEPPLWVRIFAAAASLATVGVFADFGRAVLERISEWTFRRDLVAVDALRKYAGLPVLAKE